MQHRGELLKQAIRESGIPKTRIVISTNKSRRWLYNQFERSDVSLDVLLEIGKIIHHDFSLEVAELRSKSADNAKLVEDSDFAQYNETPEFWKNKYFKLLDAYTDLAKKLK
jgi:hypothetical protein